MARRELGKQVSRFRIAVAGVEGLDGGFLFRPGDDGPYFVRIDAECGLQGVRQAGRGAFPPDNDAVNDQGRVRRRSVRNPQFLDIPHFPVPVDAQKALSLEVAQRGGGVLGQQGFRGGRQYQARLFGEGGQGVRNLVRGLPDQFLSRLRVVGAPGRRVQDAQVIQDFRDASQQGPGMLVPGGLLQGKSGGKSRDTVHVRLVRLFDSLSGPGGQAVQKASAGFGKKRVERQGGLAGAGRTAEGDQLAGRQVQVQILQVVLAGAADGNGKIHVRTVW